VTRFYQGVTSSIGCSPVEGGLPRRALVIYGPQQHSRVGINPHMATVWILALSHINYATLDKLCLVPVPHSPYLWNGIAVPTLSGSPWKWNELLWRGANQQNLGRRFKQSALCCPVERSLATLSTWNVARRSEKHIFPLVFILIWINSNLNSSTWPGATIAGSRDVKRSEPHLELWACCNAENHPNTFPGRPQTPLQACSRFALQEWFTSFMLTAITIALSHFLSP